MRLWPRSAAAEEVVEVEVEEEEAYMLGSSVLLSRGWRVCGDVLLLSSHKVISGRLYVKPSAARTGSVMISRVKTVSQSSIGACDMPVDEGGAGELEGLGSGNDCMPSAQNCSLERQCSV